MKHDVLASKSRFYNFILGFCISAVALIFVYEKFDWKIFYEKVRSLELGYLFLAAMCIVVLIHLRADRWRRLLGVGNRSVVYKYYWGGHFFNLILPAKLGDVIRVALAIRYVEKPAGYVLARSFIDRFFDIVGLLGLCVVGVFVTHVVSVDVVMLGFVVLGGSLLCFYFLLKVRFVSVVDVKILKVLASAFSDAKIAFLSLSVEHIFFSSVLTFFALTLDVMLSHFLIKSFGLSLPIEAPLVITLFLYLGAVLPSAPAQLGVHQAVVVAAMSFYGIHAQHAITYSMVQLAITMLVVLFVAGILWLFIRGK